MLIEVAAIYLANEVEFAERTVALPGVLEALAGLTELGAVQTVVTGNIEPIARMKVTAARVADRLSLDVGGYGSDHHLRAELVHTAARRIAATFEPVAPHRTWVVGDTPRDLECARAAGVRCVLVATGTNPYERLAALEPDAVFADLTDLDRLLDVIADADVRAVDDRGGRGDQACGAQVAGQVRRHLVHHVAERRARARAGRSRPSHRRRGGRSDPGPAYGVNIPWVMKPMPNVVGMIRHSVGLAVRRDRGAGHVRGRRRRAAARRRPAPSSPRRPWPATGRW